MRGGHFHSPTNYGGHFYMAVFTKFPILGHFPVLHKIVITYQNDVKLQPWLPDDSRTPSRVFQASSHMPHHHICHVIASFDFLWLSLTFTEFCPAIMSWLVLGHYGTLLDINDNSCQPIFPTSDSFELFDYFF